jgi:Tetratricopeptide repeat
MTQSASPPAARRAPSAAPAAAPKLGETAARRADPREDPVAGKKRAVAFASALAETATRTTPVHSFAVPPEAIPVVNQPRRRTPPPIFSAAFPAATPPPASYVYATAVPAVAVVAPAAGVAGAAPSRRAAVTATMASLGSGVAATALARAPMQVTPAPAMPAAPAPAPALVLVPGTTPAASVTAARGVDAWNISSYIDGNGAPAASGAPAVGDPIPEPQPAGESVPIDVEGQAPAAGASLWQRLPARRIGLILGAGALVAALVFGGVRLLGGSRTGGSVRGLTHAPLPSLVMPQPVADPASARASARAEAVAGAKPGASHHGGVARAPVEQPGAAPVTTLKDRIHAERVKAVAKHAEHRAPSSGSSSRSPSSSRSRVHRRVAARASAPERDESVGSEADRVERAKEANRQGNERLLSGDAGGAVGSYEETIRLNPKDAAGYRGLGLANAQLGKRTEAVRYLRTYLKHAPNADDRAIITSRISLLQTLP